MPPLSSVQPSVDPGTELLPIGREVRVGRVTIHVQPHRLAHHPAYARTMASVIPYLLALPAQPPAEPVATRRIRWKQLTMAIGACAGALWGLLGG